MIRALKVIARRKLSAAIRALDVKRRERSYESQRVKHYRQLVEQLERDVIASARSEGEALTQVRELQERVRWLEDRIAVCGQRVGGPDGLLTCVRHLGHEGGHLGG